MKLADIEWVVRTKYHMTKEQMRLDRRSVRYARPRQIVMFLARELTDASYPKIARFFNRDHTTAMSAVRRVRWLMENNPKVAAHVRECREAVLGIRKTDKLSSTGMSIEVNQMQG